MRILIAGARGMLGTDLVREFGAAHEIAALGRTELDITDAAECAARVEEFQPEIVINSAAMTQVDGCETNVDAAFRVNGQGTGNLARAASGIGALFVHYSTDYVFDGNQRSPYAEDDPPNPQTVYGKSKLEGEQQVKSNCPDHLILRTSWVFGQNGKNFICTIVTEARQGRALRVVNDQEGSPTYTRDLAAHTRHMVEARNRGTYHVTNTGSCTWYDLTVNVLQWAGLAGMEVVPVTTEEYPLPARRPAYSVLGNFRLEREGFPLMRSWQDAAMEYVRTCL